MSASALPPMRVPTLTEVVDWSLLSALSALHENHLPVLSEALRPEDCPMSDVAPEPAPIDEAALTQRILTDLQQRVDPLIEARLHAAMAPLLERLAQDARDAVAAALRDVVTTAVAQELTRHRSPLDRVEPH